MAGRKWMAAEDYLAHGVVDKEPGIAFNKSYE